MSGGHFDYREWNLSYVAEELERDLKERWKDAAPEVHITLKKMADHLEKAREALREYDYGMSGDSNPEDGLQAIRDFLYWNAGEGKS